MAIRTIATVWVIPEIGATLVPNCPFHESGPQLDQASVDARVDCRGYYPQQPRELLQKHRSLCHSGIHNVPLLEWLMARFRKTFSYSVTARVAFTQPRYLGLIPMPLRCG